MVGVEGLNHTFYMDGVAFKSWPWAEKSSLLPGGALVLGQEQDLLMASYNSDQAFRGHVTDLNAWSRALTPTEIQQQGLCDAASTPGDWVRWDTEAWQPSGHYRRHADGPCTQKTYSLIFFNVKLTRPEAFKTLRIMGMSPFLPRNLEDAENLNRKLNVYGTNCDNDADTGNTVWINAKFNFTSNSWHNGVTGEKLQFELERHKRTYESSDGALQDTDNTWITDDNDSENCFAGLVPDKVPLFHLRGLRRVKHPRTLAYSFVLSQTSSKCSVYFIGLLLYRIIYESDGYWRLYDSGKNQTLAFCEFNGLPIGRLPWSIVSRKRQLEPEIQNLTLSICSASEFTCDDGSCISMDDRCDLVNTCGDWSDERGCEVVIVPPGYITSFPPSLSLTMTILVTLQVISVNLREMTIVLDLSVQLRWYDSNVRYRNLRPGTATNIVGTGGRHSPLWEPSVGVTPTYGFANQRSSFVVVTREAGGSYQGDGKTRHIDGRHVTSLSLLVQPVKN
nr:uncharacterized protein LOC123766140 [Procambarus clarkii]